MNRIIELMVTKNQEKKIPFSIKSKKIIVCALYIHKQALILKKNNILSLQKSNLILTRCI